MLKWLPLLLGVLLTAAGLAVLTITWIEWHQSRQVGSIGPYLTPAAGPTGTAVVYFSRSGNTALAARHVARRLGASLHVIEAPQYALGPVGLAHSALDAKAHRDDSTQLPDILPRTMDLKDVHTVWLGSPVWFYSPAPPMWAFVQNNRFDGQHVVLFNTFNSNFGADQIAAFKALVIARGAASFEHRVVLRGRMTQQLSPNEMLQAIDDAWFKKQ